MFGALLFHVYSSFLLKIVRTLYSVQSAYTSIHVCHWTKHLSLELCGILIGMANSLFVCSIFASFLARKRCTLNEFLFFLVLVHTCTYWFWILSTSIFLENNHDTYIMNFIKFKILRFYFLFNINIPAICFSFHKLLIGRSKEFKSILFQLIQTLSHKS